MATTHIDQLVVQRLGGWNLMSVAEWHKLGTDEQQSLINQAAVQFLSDGTPVDVQVALTALSPGRALTTSEPEQVLVAWPPPDGVPPRCTVSRVVMAGPRWEVLLDRPDAPLVSLAEMRRPDEFDPYDLDAVDAVDRLCRDLVALALGIGGDPLPVIGRAALDDFRDNVFRARLGNRAWKITTGQIRTLLSDRPHLRFAPAA